MPARFHFVDAAVQLHRAVFSDLAADFIQKQIMKIDLRITDLLRAPGPLSPTINLPVPQQIGGKCPVSADVYFISFRQDEQKSALLSVLTARMESLLII